MNIETLLLKSINKFKQTIQVIVPLIIIYNILSYLFTPPILRTYQLDQNIETMLLKINSQDIIFSILLILLFSLYTIIINQFILINIKQLTFKISHTLSLLILLFMIYVILIISVCLMIIIIPIPDLVLILFIMIYVALFFTIYVKIDYNKSYIESLIIGYMLFTKNFISILKLLLMHAFALIPISFIITIIGLIATQLVGPISLLLINILFYIASYFLSIVWIYFYLSLDKNFIPTQK
tara:strand:+ start:2967 stop:3683 length:717 start_codon:yes stop_codon:yes gene_type:complete